MAEKDDKYTAVSVGIGENFPNGVVDLAGSRAFINVPSGRLKAIDLHAGKQIWQSDLVSRPLCLTQDRLIVLSQRHSTSLELLIFDAATADIPLLNAIPLPAPEWCLADWSRPDIFPGTGPRAGVIRLKSTGLRFAASMAAPADTWRRMKRGKAR